MPTTRILLPIVLALVCALTATQHAATAATERATATAATAGTTYHVAVTGHDANPGTEAQPWRHLEASIRRLVAGDTLVVRGGDYREMIFLTEDEIPTGRADARITIRAADGENPVIVGKLWVARAQYLTFDNIDVTIDPDHTDYTLLDFHNGVGWIYRNAHVWNGEGYANVAIGGGQHPGEPRDYLLADNCIHDIVGHPSHPDQLTDHNIYVNYYRNGSGQGGEITRNAIFDHYDGAGIKVGDGANGTTDNVVIHRNTIYRGAHGVLIVGDSSDTYLYRNLIERTYYRSLIYGHNLTGTGNHFRTNWGWAAANGKFVDYNYASVQPIVNDGGNAYQESSLPATPSCGPEFQPPASSSARDFGRYGL